MPDRFEARIENTKKSTTLTFVGYGKRMVERMPITIASIAVVLMTIAAWKLIDLAGSMKDQVVLVILAIVLSIVLLIGYMIGRIKR